MAVSALRRLERAEAEIGLLWREASPEEHAERAEAFLAEWTELVLQEARGEAERRARGEERQRPVSRLSPVEVMGAAVSYNGEEPPDDLRRALHRLLSEPPEDFDPAMIAPLRVAQRAVLARAFERFREEA